MKINSYMDLAIQQAILAKNLGEVPVGCVIVKNNSVIGVGHNLRETNFMATAHAEIIAIENACKTLKAWRLTGCSLFVTLEPCVMCAGAIINSRISKVYIGALDKKAGAMGSAFDITRFNLGITDIIYGVRSDECSELLTDFFKQKRL